MASMIFLPTSPGSTVFATHEPSQPATAASIPPATDTLWCYHHAESKTPRTRPGAIRVEGVEDREFAERLRANLLAIRAATWHGAVEIGYERDLGSLEPGKLADFLVLNDNPLDDIRNTGEIRYVVKNGFVWDGESMTEVWPEMKALQRFHWQTEEEMRRWSAPEVEGVGR